MQSRMDLWAFRFHVALHLHSCRTANSPHPLKTLKPLRREEKSIDVHQKNGGRGSDSINYSAGFVGLAAWMSLHLTPATLCGTIIRVANA